MSRKTINTVSHRSRDFMQTACNFISGPFNPLQNPIKSSNYQIFTIAKHFPVDTFYFSDVTLSYDWTAPQNAALWQDALKTLFDPCPAGWRVPKSGDDLSKNSPWMNFVTDPAMAVANATYTTYPMNPAGGYFFYRTGHLGPTSWFPATGSRQVSSGNLYRSSDSGYSWTTPLSGSATCFLNYNSGGRVLIYDSERRAFAFSVRCIRE